jgi:hypothetical protein
MNPDRRDQSEGVKAPRRFSGLTKGSQREMPSLLPLRISQFEKSALTSAFDDVRIALF